MERWATLRKQVAARAQPTARREIVAERLRDLLPRDPRAAVDLVAAVWLKPPGPVAELLGVPWSQQDEIAATQEAAAALSSAYDPADVLDATSNYLLHASANVMVARVIQRRRDIPWLREQDVLDSAALVEALVGHWSHLAFFPEAVRYHLLGSELSSGTARGARPRRSRGVNKAALTSTTFGAMGR